MTGKSPIEDKAGNNKIGYSLIAKEKGFNHGLNIHFRPSRIFLS
jgi:hypothetical protein